MNNYFYRRLDNDDELINNAEKKDDAISFVIRLKKK